MVDEVITEETFEEEDYDDGTLLNATAAYMHRIAKIPLLTYEEEQALGALIAQGDEKAKRKIIWYYIQHKTKALSQISTSFYENDMDVHPFPDFFSVYDQPTTHQNLPSEVLNMTYWLSGLLLSRWLLILLRVSNLLIFEFIKLMFLCLTFAEKKLILKKKFHE